MLVRMKRTVFESLEDRALVRACIEPALSVIRGKDMGVKSDVYRKLTEGQQRLMLFQIFYGHSRSAAEFYWFASDYLSTPELWGKMKVALAGYGCGALLEVFGEIENALGSRIEQAALPGGKEITVLDLDQNRELLVSVTHLFEHYLTAAGEAVGKIAQHIRSQPEDYLMLDDDKSTASST